MKTQKILTYCFICLLLCVLLLFSLVGIQNEYPSIFDLEAGNLTFSDGSRVTLAFADGYSAENDAENAAVEFLKKRFDAIGYTDSSVSLQDDGTIRADLPVKSFVTDRVEAMTGVGKFTFSAAFNASAEPFDISYEDVESVRLSPSSNGYYVVVQFTEEGAKTFSGYAAPLANSGIPYLMFSVDDTYSTYINLSSEYSDDTIAIPASDPTVFLAALSSAPLPAALEVTSIETLPALISGTAMWVVIICCVIVCLALFALLILKAKAMGVFASLALLGDAFVFMIALANYRFSLSILAVASIAVVLLLSWLYYYWILSKAGKLLKEGKSSSYAFNQAVKPMTLRTLFIHVAVIFIGVLFLMFFSGTPLLIDRVVLWGALGNAVLYFAVFYLGSKTAVNAQ